MSDQSRIQVGVQFRIQVGATPYGVVMLHRVPDADGEWSEVLTPDEAESIGRALIEAAPVARAAGEPQLPPSASRIQGPTEEST